LNILDLISAVTSDIDSCFANADVLIESGFDPWYPLETATALDSLRRRYIRDAVEAGYSVLNISGVCKLSPVAIYNILDYKIQKQ